MKSVRSLIRLGKRRPPRDKSCESSGSETKGLLDRRDSSYTTSNEPSRSNSTTSLDINASDNDSQISELIDVEENTVSKPPSKSNPKVILLIIISILSDKNNNNLLPIIQNEIFTEYNFIGVIKI